MSLSTLRWIGMALAGILIAALVAVLATNLASRQIGLASEPISAGTNLAPAVARDHREGEAGAEDGGKAPPRQGGSQATTPTTTPAPPTTTPISPPSETTSEPPPASDRG
ncbi:MAG: hypothetical protein ACHQCF_02825, partial [Solirubrobacterales bacterium]